MENKLFCVSSLHSLGDNFLRIRPTSPSHALRWEVEEEEEWEQQQEP